MHNRKLVLSGISLTRARTNKYDLEVMGEIMDEVEALMEESGYLENAPFEWVGISLRYGLKYEAEPHYLGIDKKYRVLELAIELDTHDLIKAERDVIKRIFMLATLKCLIHAGNKYQLSTTVLEEQRDLLLIDMDSATEET